MMALFSVLLLVASVQGNVYGRSKLVKKLILLVLLPPVKFSGYR